MSEVIRFCSRCGFPLEGTIQLLANGGNLPIYATDLGSTEESPRKKGVKQGGMMILLAIVLVPALGVLWHWTDVNLFGFLCALSAVVLFIGGPLRMLFAAIFEEGARYQRPQMSYAPPPISPVQMGQQVRPAALPPQPAAPAPRWRPSVTGEVVRPPSVTENTTRLLNKDTDRQD
jgi:hypothetical protein